MAATKMRWGDSLDEDLGDDLPADCVVGPDAKGVRIVTQYRKNDKGDTVKTVIKTKFTKVERKVYKVLPARNIMLVCFAPTNLRADMVEAVALHIVSTRAKGMEEVWRRSRSAA